MTFDPSPTRALRLAYPALGPRILPVHPLWPRSLERLVAGMSALKRSTALFISIICLIYSELSDGQRACIIRRLQSDDLTRLLWRIHRRSNIGFFDYSRREYSN